MSVVDVHVNRAPVEGSVELIRYIPGKFFNASLDKASTDNERNIVGHGPGQGPLHHRADRRTHRAAHRVLGRAGATSCAGASASGSSSSGPELTSICPMTML